MTGVQTCALPIYFILCNGRRKFETTKDLDYIQGTEEAIGQLVRGNMFDEAYEKAYNLRDKNRYKSRFPNIIKSKPVVSQEHQIIPVSKKELQIAKDILSHADQIMVPDVDTGCPLEMVIRDIKPDHYVDDVPFDAVLYTDDLSVGILFQTDDTCPDDLKSTGMSILTIDIRNAGSFTTKRQFVQSLLNDVSNKSWL